MSGCECSCGEPPFAGAEFESRSVGVDETAGRFADVSVEQCKRCGQRWLRYFFELEAISGSGRWYRGLVSEEEAEGLTPTTAVEILCRRPWHFYGGSHFRTTGARREARLDPQHL